jgi:hypothetical protein
MVKLPWYTRLNEEGAAQVIRKTRAPTSRKVDPQALASDLNDAFYGHMAYVSMDVRSRSHSFKALKLAATRAKALSLALKEADDVITYLNLAAIAQWRAKDCYRSLIASLECPEANDRIGARDALSIAIEGVGLIVQWANHAIARGGPPPRNPAPIVELIGKTLPTVYTEHFGLRFGAGTAGDGSSDGPGIRFAVAALTAGGITPQNGKNYSAETVRTYWQNFHHQKARRGSDKSRKKS